MPPSQTQKPASREIAGPVFCCARSARREKSHGAFAFWIAAMRVFDFTQAIVRTPAHSVVDGLREDASAVPDFARIAREHGAYVSVLRAAGLSVDVLSPLEAFPDSVFVEDPALVFAEGAILLRPGAPSRLGERDSMREALRRHFGSIAELGEGEFADGGDVLVTP